MGEFEGVRDGGDAVITQKSILLGALILGLAYVAATGIQCWTRITLAREAEVTRVNVEARKMKYGW